MKNAISKVKLALMIFTTLLALSCDGEDGMDGDMGLQGSQGEQGLSGTDGVDGTNGVDGADGQDGNAEVLYSDWVPANFTGTSTSIKFMNIDFPASLPSAFSIRDTHVLLVYFTGFGDGNIYLLPVLNFRGAQFTYGFGSGSPAVEDILIRAEALTGNLTEFQIDPTRGNRFRYVIIPPNININGKSSSTQNILKKLNYLGVDINNYSQVAAYFKIE